MSFITKQINTVYNLPEFLQHTHTHTYTVVFIMNMFISIYIFIVTAFIIKHKRKNTTNMSFK